MFSFPWNKPDPDEADSASTLDYWASSLKSSLLRDVGGSSDLLRGPDSTTATTNGNNQNNTRVRRRRSNQFVTVAPKPSDDDPWAYYYAYANSAFGRNANGALSNKAYSTIGIVRTPAAIKGISSERGLVPRTSRAPRVDENNNWDTLTGPSNANDRHKSRTPTKAVTTTNSSVYPDVSTPPPSKNRLRHSQSVYGGMSSLYDSDLSRSSTGYDDVAGPYTSTTLTTSAEAQNSLVSSPHESIQERLLASMFRKQQKEATRKTRTETYRSRERYPRSATVAGSVGRGRSEAPEFPSTAHLARQQYQTSPPRQRLPPTQPHTRDFDEFDDFDGFSSTTTGSPARKTPSRSVSLQKTGPSRIIPPNQPTARESSLRAQKHEVTEGRHPFQDVASTSPSPIRRLSNSYRGTLSSYARSERAPTPITEELEAHDDNQEVDDGLSGWGLPKILVATQYDEDDIEAEEENDGYMHMDAEVGHKASDIDSADHFEDILDSYGDDIQSDSGSFDSRENDFSDDEANFEAVARSFNFEQIRRSITGASLSSRLDNLEPTPLQKRNTRLQKQPTKPASIAAPSRGFKKSQTFVGGLDSIINSQQNGPQSAAYSTTSTAVDVLPQQSRLPNQAATVASVSASVPANSLSTPRSRAPTGIARTKSEAGSEISVTILPSKASSILHKLYSVIYWLLLLSPGTTQSIRAFFSRSLSNAFALRIGFMDSRRLRRSAVIVLILAHLYYPVIHRKNRHIKAVLQSYSRQPTKQTASVDQKPGLNSFGNNKRLPKSATFSYHSNGSSSKVNGNGNNQRAPIYAVAAAAAARQEDLLSRGERLSRSGSVRSIRSIGSVGSLRSMRTRKEKKDHDFPAWGV